MKTPLMLTLKAQELISEQFPVLLTFIQRAQKDLSYTWSRINVSGL